MHKLMHHLAAGRYESPGVADRADGDETSAADPPARGRIPDTGQVPPYPRGRLSQPSRMQPGALLFGCLCCSDCARLGYNADSHNSGF